MSDVGFTGESPAAVSPAVLSQALRDAGWRLAGRRRGAYERFENEALAGPAHMLVVPLNPNASDYGSMLDAAWSAAMSSPLEGRLGEFIELRRVSPTLDAVRFRKETSAPRGLIAWSLGEDLIQSARATLSAGAKAYMGSRRKYGSAFGQFANRYLDACFMGQTQISSYVVTALAPVDLPIPTAHRAVEVEHDPGDAVPGRAITEAVVHAVGSTVEAVGHYKRTGSLAGFEDERQSGISYEIVVALHRLSNQADESAVIVEWDSARQLSMEPIEDVRFELTGADAAPLELAAKRLSVMMEPEPDTVVRGRVHLLSKAEAGGPGTIGVEWKTKQGLRKVRVRLDPDDYHRAVAAHDQEQNVVFRGTLEREKNLHWLYNAHLIRVEPREQDPTLFD